MQRNFSIPFLGYVFCLRFYKLCNDTDDYMAKNNTTRFCSSFISIIQSCNFVIVQIIEKFVRKGQLKKHELIVITIKFCAYIIRSSLN